MWARAFQPFLTPDGKPDYQGLSDYFRTNGFEVEEGEKIIQVGSALRSGLSFCRACALARIEPAWVSALARAEGDLLAQFETARRVGLTILTNEHNKIVNKSRDGETDIKTLSAIREQIASFNSQIVLWEDYTKQAELTPTRFVSAFEIYADPDDARTAIGLNKNLASDYLEKYPNIKILILAAPAPPKRKPPR